MQNREPHPLPSLLRFHLGAGGRLVQRVFVPVFCSLLIVVVFTGPIVYTRFYAALIGGRYLSSALPTTLLILSAVAVANRRLAKGLTGWLRHLPAKEKIRKWSIILGLLITISPVLIFMSLSAAAAAEIINIPVACYFIGLPLVSLAAAQASLTTKRRLLSRPILILACLCYSSLDWRLMVLGLIFHAGGSMASGPFITPKRKSGFSLDPLIHWILIWRAMRLRLLIPYIMAFLGLPLLLLFLTNNPYHALQASRAIRLSSALMLIVCSASMAHIMAARRPAWPWSRSLPWSSWSRIGWDSLFILVHLLPIVFVSLAIRWQSFLWIAGCLPGLVVFSAMAIRRAPNSRFGVFGLVLGQTLLPLILLGLSPWFCLVFLSATPMLMKQAVFEEMSLAVTQWQEVSHLADGDSQSWRRH